MHLWGIGGYFWRLWRPWLEEAHCRSPEDCELVDCCSISGHPSLLCLLVNFIANALKLLHSGVTLLSAAVSPRNRLAPSLFLAGMTMFSGSIYLLVLDPESFKPLGPVTPMGGLCLIGGWIAMIF
jgi:Protein of unknown function (DUF423)